MIRRGVPHSCQPNKVLIGGISYSILQSYVNTVDRNCLSGAGSIENWTIVSKPTSHRIKAIARFTKADEASKAVREFNNKALLQLGGSKIFLTPFVTAKLSILTETHNVIKTRLLKTLGHWKEDDYVDIKSCPSSDQGHKPNALGRFWRGCCQVARAKGAVETILQGTIVKSRSGIT